MPIQYVGVDVSSAKLDVARGKRGSSRTKFPNTQEGIAQFVAWLATGCDLSEVQVILEPTSTYHQHLVEALTGHEVKFTLLNPARTKAFAQLMGSRTKTDAVDARLLALLGETQQPQPTPAPDTARERLKAQRRHLEWLEEEQRAVRNRLDAAGRSPWTPPGVIESLKRTLQSLEQEGKMVQKDLDALIAQDPELSRHVKLLTSVRAIGRRTAVLLLSEMPPTHLCRSAKAWVAFAGLNPAIHSSGKTNWSQISRTGSARLRHGLYMAGITALTYNPAIKAQAERLTARGKSGKEKVVAAMHKLVRQCYGLLKSQQPFNLSLTANQLAA